MKDDGGTTAVAVVGVGAILPDAPDAATFWENVRTGRSSISEVPPARWDPELYYDPDPAAPDKTYSKIGGWVRQWTWDPREWKLPIPPKVADAIDDAQKWAVACTRSVLEDHAARGGTPVDRERTAVIIGNAMAGELHYMTALRIFFPEYAEALAKAPSFIALPEDVRRALVEDLRQEVAGRFPPITEDTMPGELGNILAGRVANLFDFRGPNFITDAACGSAMAAVDAAVRGLMSHDFDSAISGGIDRNMGASSFVKFCKIGALSATGTRPYAEGADGFVMGEGAALFLLKRLEDAERDGDRIYALIRGMAGSSDGRGKGITAPNPVGQRLAVERAWRKAGLDPATATLVEGHGTSTKVGDVVEVASLAEGFGDPSLAPGSIALGSVKSNIGHLKAAAGGAGLLKTVLALADGVLPPSINYRKPNPDIDFAHSPFRVNTELREWERPAGDVRRAGVSAFGFGGTNWHAVLEEYVPGRLPTAGGRMAASSSANETASIATPKSPEPAEVTEAAPGPPVTDSELVAGRAPLRGALVVGGNDAAAISERLAEIGREASAGRLPPASAPSAHDLDAPERVAIDYGDADELVAKIELAAKALATDAPAMWKALKARGIFRGSGPSPKVAFLYPGQGSQYANMARALADADPMVAATFAEADEVMTPLLGRTLTSYLFVDSEDPAAMAGAETDLMQTAITQPAVLTVDRAMTDLLALYGIRPDMVMGHSLGEYGALVAAGALTFPHALEAVSARGREMTSLSMEDNGKMAAVLGPLAEIERILEGIDGNVVIANVNSTSQAVIGGASDAVDRAVAAVTEAGMQAIPLPVSHAFHTSIVAPASVPMRAALVRLDLRPPELPVVANVSGEFYPTDGDVTEQMLDILAKQVASPVQFVKGLHTLYEAGARVFVEVGPKKALQGFVDDVLAGEDGVVSLFTNHPKVGDVASFNQALCGLYAAGLGARAGESPMETTVEQVIQAAAEVAPVREAAEEAAVAGVRPADAPAPRRPVVVTGVGLGLPGTEHVFEEGNAARILAGEQLIDAIPGHQRKGMLGKHITRLVKRENGDPTFETIDDESEVIKLAGRAGAFDLEGEFGVAAERIPALDRSTKLAIAAGIDALRDAGIPLVMHYKTTTMGTQLPERWGLPTDIADDTGVIFASAFPGLDAFAGEMNAYHLDRARRERLADLRAVRERVPENDPVTAAELDRRIADLDEEIAAAPYQFDRRFLFKTLSMGHSQFAEVVGARGPNTQVNSACASTTQAIGLAEDWIAEGRCSRVIVIAADDATSDNLFEWIGSGFLASGAAATDAVVEDAATPFDRRRHGMIVGMGAAGLVVESAAAAEERGIRPICEVLNAVHANSAFHGTRLDVHHIAGLMERLVSEAERRWGIRREEIAPELVFVSHETYTPARGGSAAAEVEALRTVFGPLAGQVVVANTKGFTGHPMGVGIEDVVAVRILESGIVPPVPNYREPDPQLGTLNLSKGGSYPVRYALRLAAGFGSQIAMSLLRWVPSPDGSRTRPSAFGFEGRVADESAWNGWLTRMADTESPELEVVQHRLRVRDEAEAARRSDEITSSKIEFRAVAGPVATSEVAVAPEPVAAPVAMAVPDPTPAGIDEPGQPAVSSLDENAVLAVVLELVAEQTGYPPDMLDPELDLEADLGVDTVKQAEIFAAIRARYDIVRDESLKLRDFPTLAHVVQFVLDRTPVPVAEDATTEPVTVEDPPPAVVSARVEAATPVAAALDEAEVRVVVLDLVAEQTGYPPDMLDPDLDLEADLGVDTVKQAEIFAAIRGRYDIPRDESLKLRDFPTLAHVVGFVMDRAPGAQAVAEEAPVAPTEPPIAEEGPPVEAETTRVAVGAAGLDKDAVLAVVLELVAAQTGYPPDMLDPELDLEADLGVDTVKQAEIFAAIRGRYDIPRDESLKLRDFPTLAHVVGFVLDRAPRIGAAEEPQPAVPEAVVAIESEPVAQPSALNENDVLAVVLELVAAQTGYPPDMLDPELDLEADLGVDTVKQAEIFAAIRSRYDIPRDESLKLRDFPTLAHVVGFVLDRVPRNGAAEEPQPAVPEAVVAIESEPVVEPSALNENDVLAVVLELVAVQTGYPPDMLDPELDLEADLGVDTVKQAEIFAAIRGRYDIPRDESLKLRDFPTLAHVVGFVMDRAPGASVVEAADGAAPEPAIEAAVAEVVAPAPAIDLARLHAGIDAAGGVPRRVAVPVLRPALERCVPTGVEIGPGARIAVVADRGGVAKDLARLLEERGAEVLLVEEHPETEAFQALIEAWLAEGAATGIFWLTALDRDDPAESFEPDAWHEALRVRVKLLAAAGRAAYERFGEAGTFLVAGTRMGGYLGMDEAGALSSLDGAVVGFVKALRREREACTVKVVDVEGDAPAEAVAQALIAEALRDPGSVEVGHAGGLRWATSVQEQPIDPADIGEGMVLGPDSVFVATGAAGSIVAEIVADLAGATGGSFHLLDLAPEPDAADPDLAAFAEGREAAKRVLVERAQAAGERPTPVAIERRLAALERGHAALSAMRAVRAAGGEAWYHQVDLTDAAAVAGAIADVRARHDRVDVLLHAAGIEISRFLSSKEQREFDLVVDVKANGWCHLLHALDGVPIGAVVAFGSVAGRFGNGGQTDYSAANGLLGAGVSNLRRTRPDTRAIVVDWTAWSGIGMASRGSIPKMMAAAGIDMLPPEVGIPFIRRELVAGPFRGELVVGNELGILLDEWVPDGGVDPAAFGTVVDGPVAGTVRSMGVHTGLVADVVLDPARHPFLDDHRIDGTPVMPGVMAMETFAEVAARALPGWHVAAVEDVAFLAPLKCYRDDPRTVTVEAAFRPRGGEVVADCRLIGRRDLPGRAEPQETIHFRGRVVLSQERGPAERVAVPEPVGGGAGADAIYQVYFHGPAYRVLELAWPSEPAVGLFDDAIPPDLPPGAGPLVASPRLVELCFQTAGMWEICVLGRFGLPASVGRVRFGADPAEATGSIRAVVRPVEGGAAFEARVVDAEGTVLVALEGYRTVELPGAIDAESLATLRSRLV